MRAFAVDHAATGQVDIAYSDPMDGERGVIYRAVNMRPTMMDHHTRYRVRPPSVKWHEHHWCLSDRWLRMGDRDWTHAEARSKGYLTHWDTQFGGYDRSAAF